MELFYSILYLLGGLAEITLLGILLLRREYRRFPVFTAYIAFNVLSDGLAGVLSANPKSYAADWTALFLLPPQYLLELGVLLEIAWKVLQPVRSSLPPKAIKAFATSVVIAILGGIALAWHVNPHSAGIYEKLKFPLDSTVGLLRLLLFLTTAGFAQMLGIGWRSKVLQLASGLSLYSVMDLIASLAQGSLLSPREAGFIRAAGYFLELAVFIGVFTTKDVARREFSPQMRQFLVTISHQARETRAALVRSQVK